MSSRIRHGISDRVLSPLRRIRVRAAGVGLDGSVVLLGSPIVSMAPRSSINIGSRSVLISSASRTALGVSRPVILRTLAPGARIVIGADAGLSGTTICAVTNVELGARVLAGADVLIADTDFHLVDEIPRRYAGLPEPGVGDAVSIGDDVFLGARSVVLRGVTIGSGSVVGAGSVVTGDIPSYVIAAGNPCRVIRQLSERRADGVDG